MSITLQYPAADGLVGKRSSSGRGCHQSFQRSTNLLVSFSFLGVQAIPLLHAISKRPHQNLQRLLSADPACLYPQQTVKVISL